MSISQLSQEAALQAEKMGRFKMMGMRAAKIPDYMREPLACYIADHKPTGGFLRAILSGDLIESVLRADDQNIHVIPVYVGFLLDRAPREAWGTPEAYRAWTDPEKWKEAT